MTKDHVRIHLARSIGTSSVAVKIRFDLAMRDLARRDALRPLAFGHQITHHS